MAANKSFQLSTRFTEEERNALVKYSEENDMPIAQIIRKAVREYLQSQKDK